MKRAEKDTLDTHSESKLNSNKSPSSNNGQLSDRCHPIYIPKGLDVWLTAINRLPLLDITCLIQN